MSDDGQVGERTPEAMLESLIRKDIDPDITAMARRALDLRRKGEIQSGDNDA